MDVEEEQRAFCLLRGAEYVAAPAEAISGFAKATKGKMPVNGIRNRPTEKTTGWFVWCGEEFSNAGNFFGPICTIHICEEYPEVAKLLGLPAGYRFLMAGEYLDVWFDESLLVT